MLDKITKLKDLVLRIESCSQIIASPQDSNSDYIRRVKVFMQEGIDELRTLNPSYTTLADIYQNTLGVLSI